VCLIDAGLLLYFFFLLFVCTFCFLILGGVDFSVCFCYLSLVVDEGDAQIRHGSQDGHQRLNSVAVDHRSILFEIIRCEAALVNDSKLEKSDFFKYTTLSSNFK